MRPSPTLVCQHKTCTSQELSAGLKISLSHQSHHQFSISLCGRLLGFLVVVLGHRSAATALDSQEHSGTASAGNGSCEECVEQLCEAVADAVKKKAATPQRALHPSQEESLSQQPSVRGPAADPLPSNVCSLVITCPTAFRLDGPSKDYPSCTEKLFAETFS